MRINLLLRSSKFKLFAFSLIAILFFTGIQLHAQQHEKFYNLKVLPKRISKEKLHSIMRNFTRALGVDCEFCHAENTSEPGHKLDFTLDKKPAKRKARVMMKMVQEINGDYISKIADMSENQNTTHVMCVTCHHGQPNPRTLEEELMHEINKKGVDSAINKYHDLYKKYYGGFSYNFKDDALEHLTEQLIDAKKTDAAIAMSKLNTQMYPKSGRAYYGLGAAYEAKGDKQTAIQNYKKALEFMPGNRWLMRKIDKLQNQ